MADGGRYRRRRFAAFAVSAEALSAKRTSHIIRAETTTRSMRIERWFGR